VTITGTHVTPLPSGNDFSTELQTATNGNLTFADGSTVDLSFLLDATATLRFDLVAHESRASNGLIYGTDVISETSSSTNGLQKVANFKTDTLGGQSFIKTGVSGNFASLISLFVDGNSNGAFDTGETAYDFADAQFGVFFDGDGSTVSGNTITSKKLTHFFIGLDDVPAGADDNHDDIVVRVSVVPLPAAAWLLLGVSGGLIAAKRRSARKAA
jgi:hypothetical protein